MTTRNVADDASNTNKTSLVDNDAFLIRDSESNPNSLKEASKSDVRKTLFASPAQGDILYYNGSDWVRLAAGTSGKVLQTNGAAANPSWVTPGAAWGGITGTLSSQTDLQYALNPQQGFLINGKLSVTVASNNLTVALKTLAGNNPSASEPVYVRMQDTVDSITAALSVTKNAGTNWFNAGAAELATKEIDYFVYLGYNATDGVVIGFARIPYARSEEPPSELPSR